MPQRREGIRTVLRLLASLAVVLIPFGTYSYLYVDRQYDYHVNRNFRVLTEAGAHLNALLRQFESLFDFDPYNEIEKMGYPIREMVEKRFKKQCAVEKFLEKLENIDPTEEEKEGEGKISKKIEKFRNALKDALDKERALRSLENSLKELLIKVELERFTDQDKKELALDLGRLLQSQAASEKDLTRALSYPPPKLVREALEKARKEACDAWKEVAKTQKQALAALDKNAEDSPMRVQYVSNRKADAEHREECKELAYNKICSKGENEKTDKEAYICALEEIQKGRVGRLRKQVRVLDKNPAYKNLRISSGEDNLCVQANSKGSPSLQVNTSKAQTFISVVECQQKDLSGRAQRFEAVLPLSDLMHNTDAEAKNFDLLVLAQEDGKVLYGSETNSAGIPRSVSAKFASLKSFFQEDKSEAEPEKTDSDNENDQKDKNGQVSIPLASVIREAEISGTTYLLFLQPFQPPFPIVSQSDEAQPVWYLGGIIRKGEFQKKFLAIPLIVVGLVMLGLILGILSWPYVKLFFANTGEPLRAIDLFFLIVSLVLSSGLITLLLLNTVAYHNMRTQFDDTAEGIRNRIKVEFGEELADTLGTFSEKSIIDKLEKPLKSTGNGVVSQSGLQAVVFSGQNFSDCDTTGNGQSRGNGRCLTLSEDRYPPYESIFLVEKHGSLEPEHWITFKPRKPTKSVDISRRQYFLHAKEKQELWKKGGSDFFIERVSSYTDGVKTSVISTPYEKIGQRETDFDIERIHSRTNGEKDSAVSENNNGDEEFVVTALAKRFLSFRSLALPPNFGFAVIENDTGKVIFHSDDQRSLIENFFWETDDNLKLQAAVQAKRTDKIAGHYNGKKHHFFVTPIESVPWSLVVFYDTRLLETVNFEIGVVAAGIFFLYVAIFVLGIAAIHLLVPGKHWSWCWPQSEFQNQYVWIALPFVLVVLGYGLGIFLLEGWPLLLLIVSLPLGVLGLLYLCFKLKRSDGAQRWKHNVAGFITFLGVVGVLSVCFVPYSSSQYAGPVGATLSVVIVFFAWAVLTLTPVWSKEITEGSAQNLSFRSWYLLIAFLSLFVVSVLPSAAIFKDTFLTQSKRFTEFRESEFVTSLENREKTLRNDMYDLTERSEVSTVKKITESEKFVEKEIKPGLYEYEKDKVCFYGMNQNRLPLNVIRLTATGEKILPYKIVKNPCTENKPDPGDNKYLSGWFIDFLPVYDELAGKLRYPVSKQASLSHSEDGVKIQYQALSSLPVFRVRGSWSSWIGGLGIPIFLIILFLLIRALAKRTVGLYLSDFEVLEKDSEETTMHKLFPSDDSDKDKADKAIEQWVEEWSGTDKKRQILIRPPRALVSELKKADDDQNKDDQSKFEVVDLSSPIPFLLGKLRGWSSVPLQTGILVTNFEVGILEPRLRFALLEALEECVRAEIPVILCSSVSPLYRLVTPEAYPEFDNETPDSVPKADEKFRWSALLSTFRKERFWYKAADWRKQDKLSLATLSRECCWTDELMYIYEDLENKVAYLTEEQIIHQVGDRAGAFYRKLWMLCTKDERLVLIHLAQGNWVNLKDTEVVQRLLWCNLIQRDPDLRLPNESFARFVLTAEPSAQVAEWEKGEAEGSTWTALRAPFVLSLVLVAAFIAYTGGEGVNATITTVSAALAGLPILIQVLNFLRGGQTDKLTGE